MIIYSMQDLHKETITHFNIKLSRQKMATGKGRMASGFYSAIS